MMHRRPPSVSRPSPLAGANSAEASRGRRRLGRAGLVAAALLAALPAWAGRAAAATLTIATVNNPDMLVMQKLSPQFTRKTGIKLD
jgi:ABC-type glycerol-3-phosphate transport system substrate-binding protein